MMNFDDFVHFESMLQMTIVDVLVEIKSKKEKASHKHLLFPPCFQKAICFCLGSFGIGLTLSQTSPGFYVSAVQVFRKHGGKRRKYT